MSVLRYITARKRELNVALQGDLDITQTATTRGRIRELIQLEAELMPQAAPEQIPGAGVFVA